MALRASTKLTNVHATRSLECAPLASAPASWRRPCCTFGRQLFGAQTLPIGTATRAQRDSEPKPLSSKKVVTSNSPGSSSDSDDEDTTPTDLAVATSMIEKVAGAVVVYGLAMLLGKLTDLDVTQQIRLADAGSAFVVGLLVAAPGVAFIAMLFLPQLDPGFSAKQLQTVANVDQEEDSIIRLAPFSGEGEQEGAQPAMTPQALSRGLWFYQMHVLKPWYPAFEWSRVGALYAASCAASSAQELLVRGWGGQVLTGWWTSIIAGATDASNPLYWAKVFKLVTPDTPRWLAAAAIIAVQLSLSVPAASRAARFTRLSLNKLEPGKGLGPGAAAAISVSPPGVLRREVSIDIPLPGGGAAEGGKEGDRIGVAATVTLEVPTAEERVAYSSSLAVSAFLCACTNVAWAASGSLLGSFTTQIVIDGLVTTVQQLKAVRLPDKDRWEEVQALEEAAEQEEEARAIQEAKEALRAAAAGIGKGKGAESGPVTIDTVAEAVGEKGKGGGKGGS